MHLLGSARTGTDLSREHRGVSPQLPVGRFRLMPTNPFLEDISGPTFAQHTVRILEVALAPRPHRMSYTSICNKQINNEERMHISL